MPHATGETPVPHATGETPVPHATGETPVPHATAETAVPQAAGAARLAAVAELRLRPAGVRDQRPLEFFFDAVLRRDYFLRRGQLAEMLTGTRHRVLVAEIEGVLVGVAVLTRGARLVNVLVHPAYRGLGIGRALVERSAAREVRAKIDVSTGDPRGFYRGLGFVATGERNGKGNVELMQRVCANGSPARPHQPQRRGSAQRAQRGLSLGIGRVSGERNR